MWDKIKAFLQNKVVILVECILIAICCAGLIIAGVTVEEIAKVMDMPVEKVIDIQKISQDTVSLDTPVGEEEDSLLGDFIEDKEVENPANLTAYTLLQEQVHSVLATLPAREQEVLKMRFGLDDGYSLTL